MIVTDFWATEAGQFIIGAHRYISAARVLRYSHEAETKGELLKTPILHLLAHGIELLLKYPLLRAGDTQWQVTKEYGHDLQKLWHSDRNQKLREEISGSAKSAWSGAAASGSWPDDDFTHDPEVVLLKAINDIGHLHGRGSSFALRYTISGPTMAPRPGFLIDAFGVVAERTAMNPGYLDY